MILSNGVSRNLMLICPLLQIGMPVKDQNRIANMIEPDETAHYEQCHQNPHCLHRYLARSTGNERVKLTSLAQNLALSSNAVPNYKNVLGARKD